MKVLTIQSKDLKISGRVFPDKTKCNHTNALPVYHRLFTNYNMKNRTDYDNFFWGFSKLRKDNLNEAVFRAAEMIGINISDKSTEQILILEVPDEICLITDFYNFSDEIFAYENPNELDSAWENIYSNRDSEKQVIFPYIDEEMIVKQINLKDFTLSFNEFRNARMGAIQDMLKRMNLEIQKTD